MSGLATRAYWIAYSVFVAACGGDGGGGGNEVPAIDCSEGAIPGYSEVTAFDVCANCHGSGIGGTDRNGAPVGLDLDVYEDAVEHAALIVRQVSRGNMPPAESGYSLTNEQKQQLYIWAECGTPE